MRTLITLVSSVIAMAATTANAENWDTQTESNPLDDSTTAILVTPEIAGQKGVFGDPVTASIRCLSGNVDLIINWGNYLGPKAEVTTRIGSETATTSEWNISNAKDETLHPEPKPFIKRMAQSNQLIAQITPYLDDPITATFDTSGLNSKLDIIYRSCGAF